MAEDRAVSPLGVADRVKWLVRRAWTAVFMGAVGLLAACHNTLSSLFVRPGRKRQDVPERILVLRFGLFGDGILLTPTLRLLRNSYPRAQIHVLATPIQVPVFDGLTSVDRVIVWRAGDLLEPRHALRLQNWLEAAACVRELRGGRYDLALACYGPLSSAVALLSGAAVRVGFAGEAAPGTLTRALPGQRWEHPLHDAEYSVEVARAAGAQGETPRTEIAVTAEAKRAVEERFIARAARAGPVEGGSTPPPAGEGSVVGRIGSARVEVPRQRLILLHPGATNGDAKRWPAEHWEELTVRLLEDGHVLAFAGAGEEDGQLAEGIIRGARRRCPQRGRVINAVNETSLPELVALSDRADVVVSGDSGPMHVAVARGRPTVAVHGPTDPGINGPFGAERAIVVRHSLACSPCYRLGRVANCPLGHTLCQRLIAPHAVYDAVRDLLDVAH